MTAACISAALRTATRSAPGGAASGVGPLTSVTAGEGAARTAQHLLGGGDHVGRFR